jgi:hypothetical protein
VQVEQVVPLDKTMEYRDQIRHLVFLPHLWVEDLVVGIANRHLPVQADQVVALVVVVIHIILRQVEQQVKVMLGVLLLIVGSILQVVAAAQALWGLTEIIPHHHTEAQVAQVSLFLFLELVFSMPVVEVADQIMEPAG